MSFKINISKKDGKTFKLETDREFLVGKKIGETIDGSELTPELSGYELEITGLSDKSGLPALKNVEGQGHRRVLLTYGKGLRRKPKGLSKKPVRRPKGLRLRKTVSGNTISRDIVQINTKVKKEGQKKLEEIFPEQVKQKEEKTEQKAEIKEQK